MNNTAQNQDVTTKPSNQDISGWLQAVAQQRDRRSFEQLYERFAPRLKSYMIRQGADIATADELTQEAMVKIWHKAEQYDPNKAAPGAWIFRIARNLQIDRLRKRKYFEVELKPENDQVDEGITGHERSLERIDADRLHDLLDDLSEEQMKVIKMAFFEGLTHSEICEKLELPLGTVKSRMRLAFRKLRTAIGDKPWE